MSETGHKGHFISYGMLIAVWAALLAGTGVTVFVAGIDLGRLNVWIALTIASVKASLVLLFFMHLKYEPRIFLYMFLSVIVVIVLFTGFMFFDVPFR